MSVTFTITLPTYEIYHQAVYRTQFVMWGKTPKAKSQHCPDPILRTHIKASTNNSAAPVLRASKANLSHPTSRAASTTTSVAVDIFVNISFRWLGHSTRPVIANFPRTLVIPAISTAVLFLVPSTARTPTVSTMFASTTISTTSTSTTMPMS
ncbi:hypothetical protein N7G274_003310 [Stereocaulon virgatum]|uniref:Uncharacterized protein n=1 Tax=Stereocaulon virgatum TaxID=373712 RepID=A0ABR4AG42_9LECA